MRTSRAVAGAVCAAVAATGTVGCGGESDQQPSAFCKSVDALDSAVSQINQDPFAKSTLPAVEESLGQIDSTVKTLSQNADADFAPQVEAVESGLEELDQAVAAATEKPTPKSVDAARTAMRSFTASVDDLAESTSSSC